MAHSLRSLGLSRRLGTTAVATAFILLSSLAVEAAGHRAKLSLDLEDLLASGSPETVQVILSGTADEVRTVAARHGAKVKKELKFGGVIEVTARQLAALSADPAVPHLSGDARVQRMMAVSSQATGADQVWSGVAGLPGYTGRGIGVAVIDSGVFKHKSLQQQVVASYDFTGGKQAGDDYGHGTHIAGTIAGNDASYAGLAPDSHIVSLRVLGADGSGDTSDVISAIDFAIENRVRFGIRIINLSLGRPVFESYKS